MRHRLTFRGERLIPAGTALCTACGALLEIEAWLTDECPGAPKETEHVDPLRPRDGGEQETDHVIR